jgi:alpha-L-fucosidase
VALQFIIWFNAGSPWTNFRILRLNQEQRKVVKSFQNGSALYSTVMVLSFFVCAHFLAFTVLPSAGNGLVVTPGVIPLPTRTQVRYQQAEIIATVGFQMDTYAYDDGDPGCNAQNWNRGVKTSDPSTLAPTDLNITQWALVLQSLGAKIAWMNAKHGCGFLMFKTSAKIPGTNKPYGYDVFAPGAIQRDVVAEFREEMMKVGISPGYYYSLKDNFYLNVHTGGTVGTNATLLPGMQNVTQSEFEQISLAQLRELWTNYGALSETWFDGGWAPTMAMRLKALVQELLPHTAAFGGFGVSDNPVKWVGTESGLPVGPIWSLGSSRQGESNGTVFVPTGCDTVLMTPHTWFAIKGMGVRTLEDMINSYHRTVGNNCVMELGFAPLRSGLIPLDQVSRAKEFGDWIRTCYGNPAGSANISRTKGGHDTTFTILLKKPSAVDRVLIQEDISYGQRIREYQVEAKSASSDKWLPFSEGRSVGHKKIDLVSDQIDDVTALRLTLLASVGNPYMLAFQAFYPCQIA